MRLTKKIVDSISKKDIQKLISENHNKRQMVIIGNLVCAQICESKRLLNRLKAKKCQLHYGVCNTYHAELENIDNSVMEKFLFTIL